MSFPCFDEFLSEFATDFGVTEARQKAIATKIEQTVANYEKIKPKTSLETIVKQGSACILGKLESSVAQVEKTSFGYSLICAFIVFVVSTVAVFSFSYLEYSWLWLFLAIIIMIGLLALATILFQKQLISDVPNITSCVAKTQQELETYLTDQETAVLTSFCYYASLPPVT